MVTVDSLPVVFLLLNIYDAIMHKNQMPLFEDIEVPMEMCAISHGGWSVLGSRWYSVCSSVCRQTK